MKIRGLPACARFIRTSHNNNGVESSDDFDEDSKDVAEFVRSQRGDNMLVKLNGFTYRKTYKTKNGTRWVCSTNKFCGAHVVISGTDEILAAYEVHGHDKKKPMKDMLKLSEYDTIEGDTLKFVRSKRGNKLLELNGFRYRKCYKSRNGTRWVCATDKYCAAHVLLSETNEILTASEQHEHGRKMSAKAMCKQLEELEEAELVVSRDGDINLIYENFAYRKKNPHSGNSRWVCATEEACGASLFVDSDNRVVSGLTNHTHPSPKINKVFSHIPSHIQEKMEKINKNDKDREGYTSDSD